MPAPFDTLELAERLGHGGFTAEQAQTLATALSHVFSAEAATKPDLVAMRQEIEARLTELRLQLDGRIKESTAALQSQIAESKVETLRWVVGLIGFQLVAILSAIFTMLKLFLK